MHPLVRRLAPPTTGRLDVDGFLALGATVGTVGWAGTWLLARWGGATSPLAAATLWLVLVGVMGAVGGTQTPDTVRFSRPLAVWGATNGTATVVSLVAVGRPGTVPQSGVLAAWFGSFLVGYAATAMAIGGRRARPYVLGAALASGGLLVTLVAAASTTPEGYLLAGAVHVLPLLLAVR